MLIRLKRFGNNLQFWNSISTYSFTGSFLNYDSAEWTLFYIGIGPTSNSFYQYGVCHHIKSGLNPEYGDCVMNDDDFSTLYANTNHYNITLGLGMSGYMSNFYTTNYYFKMPSVFTQNQDGRNDTRMPCYNSQFEYEPFCIGIEGWGNGIYESLYSDTMTTEECDDANLEDDDRCDSSCQIEYKSEWIVSSTYEISVCTPKWGNGKYESTEDEECDDYNRSDNDGCTSDCKKEDGYTFYLEDNELTIATPIWGDQIRVPAEIWDDDDIDDGQGCKSDCSGPLRGWTCSSVSPAPSVCTFTINDGVRADNGEDCDDGNSDDDDGCSTLGVVDPQYTCYDDILGRSVCSAHCGNGKRDYLSEQWDDGNSINGDGCSSDWSVESGFYWHGGSLTMFDRWNVELTLKFVSISKENTVVIEFSQEIQMFNIQGIQQ